MKTATTRQRELAERCILEYMANATIVCPDDIAETYGLDVQFVKDFVKRFHWRAWRNGNNIPDRVHLRTSASGKQ